MDRRMVASRPACEKILKEKKKGLGVVQVTG
jgi:hypothetical protein